MCQHSHFAIKGLKRSSTSRMFCLAG